MQRCDKARNECCDKPIAESLEVDTRSVLADDRDDVTKHSFNIRDIWARIPNCLQRHPIEFGQPSQCRLKPVLSEHHQGLYGFSAQRYESVHLSVHFNVSSVLCINLLLEALFQLFSSCRAVICSRHDCAQPLGIVGPHDADLFTVDFSSGSCGLFWWNSTRQCRSISSKQLLVDLVHVEESSAGGQLCTPAHGLLYVKEELRRAVQHSCSSVGRPCLRPDKVRQQLA
mmetsp:Transcript_7650/g.23162  ORF Transcript_7650/g.23162 Transcript_7650/m.23162 type:complete len:228 (+) Transcript_7650:1090-1773(+)